MEADTRAVAEMTSSRNGADGKTIQHSDLHANKFQDMATLMCSHLVTKIV